MKRIGLLATMLLLLLLAGCQIPGTGMPDDGPPIPVSEEAAARMEQKAAAAALTSGQSTTEISQEEITSYLALRIASAEVPLRQPQIYFKETGEIVLRATIEYEGQSQPIRLAAIPSAAAGSLALDVTSARIGPLPIPGPILDQVEGYLAEAILAGQNYASLDAIAVGNGTLTITGQRQ